MTWKASSRVEPLAMPTTLKFVLLKYSNHADDDGFDAWPSYERIAHFTSQNKKTVERAVERLRDEQIMIAQADPYGGRGKRGRGIAYRIDFDRAMALYGYWVEKRTNRGFDFELVKATKDPKQEAEIYRAALKAAQETAQEAAKETGDGESSVSQPQTDDSQSQTDDSQDGNRRLSPAATRQVSADSSGESSLESTGKDMRGQARARATGPDGGPDTPALEDLPPGAAPRRPGAPEGHSHANTVWRAHLDALSALPGWPLLERCIPDADDGETLTLAVESPMVGFAVLAFARHGAEALLGRRLACRVRYWVGLALIEHGVARAGTYDATRHRRDGDLVTLDDPAWALWCGHKEEIEALDCRNILGDCLPDDVTPDGLVLCGSSMTVLNALHEGAGAAAARILGVAIRGQARHAHGPALAARGALVRTEAPETSETGDGTYG